MVVLFVRGLVAASATAVYLLGGHFFQSVPKQSPLSSSYLVQHHLFSGLFYSHLGHCWCPDVTICVWRMYVHKCVLLTLD